jgi:hypothetical protein
MDAEWKEKWVEALRSGNYEQGEGTLKNISDDGYEYCCLGVLCEIHPDVEFRGTVAAIHKPTKDEYDIFLPSMFRNALNISCDDEKELANLNDGGYSFDTIAGWIEEYL